jgi:FKBP-type peptidyl-prolyl cis-trans isomerase SlpA
MSVQGIRLGDHVTLHYRLSCMGKEIVSTFGEAPETFRIGSGELDVRLEKLLLGKPAGLNHTFHLTPWEAFGERDEALIQSLPRKDFSGDVPVGHQVNFELPNGTTLLGTVIEVDEKQVKVDFNHPLAGLPVEFEIEILSVEHDH